MIAFGMLAIAPIPQPTSRNFDHEETKTGKVQIAWQELSFGLRYLCQHPPLMTLQLFTVSFIFFDNAALLEPVVLARTGNSVTALGSVVSALALFCHFPK